MSKAIVKHNILTLSVLAAGAILHNRFVTTAGAQAGAKANTVGVADTDAVAGETVAVVAIGMISVEAGAAVAKGAAIETDAQGRAVTRTDGPTVGRALTAAAAAGQFVEVLLIQN